MLVNHIQLIFLNTVMVKTVDLTNHFMLTRKHFFTYKFARVHFNGYNEYTKLK